MNSTYDAVVVGAGPNGLAAAITLAKKGLSVTVLEASSTIGGGTRSQELTLPGFVHDVCSAVHPLAVASPVFRELPLHEHGLSFVNPTLPLAHPFEGERAAVLNLAVLNLDEARYAHADTLLPDVLGPLRFPKHPVRFARFGVHALLPATITAKWFFRSHEERALWAGIAAHSALPLTSLGSSAAAMILTLAARAANWPFAKGGSQSIADALANYLRSLGGEIVPNCRVKTAADIPNARMVLFDLTPKQILNIEGLKMPDRYRHRLGRFRYGPGVFKLDWALNNPIPWRAQACREAGTVHIGGSLTEIAQSEQAIWNGSFSERPFVILAQPSLFDKTRAPEGNHTAWAYCHVPHGSRIDATQAIEDQIERYAPGFRDCIIARHAMGTKAFEEYNANDIGGDILGGAMTIGQLLSRPVWSLDPYHIPSTNMYICSSSTPPGGGVHGVCGYFAAQSALSRL